MPATPYVHAGFGAPRARRIEPIDTAICSGVGSGTATFSVVPQPGDIIIASSASDNDFGAFNAQQPSIAYPSGCGVVVWANLGLEQSLGGAQLSHATWVGKVDQRRRTTSKSIALQWTNNGVGIISLWRGLEGVIRDREMVIQTGSGSTTCPTFGGDWGRGGIVIADVAFQTSLVTRPTYGGIVMRSAREVSANGNVYIQAFAPYRGGMVSVSWNAGGKSAGDCAVIY